MHSRTATTLQTLQDVPSIRLEAVFIGEDSDGLTQQYKKGKKTIFSISIDIYGPGRAAEDVGKRLSKAHTYLQHPIYLDGNVPYNNPHYYDIPRMRKADVSVLSSPRKKCQQSPILDIAKVFEEVDQTRRLPSRNVNCHVMTPLLEYDSFLLSTVRAVLTLLILHQTPKGSFILHYTERGHDR